MWIDGVRWEAAKTTVSWALLRRIRRIHGTGLPAHPASSEANDSVLKAGQSARAQPAMPPPSSLDAFTIFVFINPQRTKLHFILFGERDPAERRSGDPNVSTRARGSECIQADSRDNTRLEVWCWEAFRRALCGKSSRACTRAGGSGQGAPPVPLNGPAVSSQGGPCSLLLG